jgi:hypothetical protein
MRLTVTFDRHGTIASVAVSEPDAPAVRVELQPGQQVAEVDAPELEHAFGSQAMVQHVSDLIASHRVDVEAATAKLTRSPSAAD